MLTQLQTILRRILITSKVPKGIKMSTETDFGIKE